MSTQFTNRQWRLPNEENKSKVSNYSMDFLTTTRIPDITGLGLGTSVDTFSISLWFNKSNMNYGIVFSTYSGTGSYITSGVAINLYTDGTIGLYNGAARTTTSAQYSINTWYNLVVTSDGTTVKMYVNGSQVTLNSTTAVARDFTNVWINSAKYSASNFGIVGKIDGVAIFDYALSSSQVTTLYGSSSTGIGNPMSLSPAPVAYYPLGDQDAFNGANYLVPNSSLKDYVFNFNGSNYIATGTTLTNLSVSTSFSISCWVKITSNVNYYHIVGAPTSYSAWNTGFGLYTNGSGIRFWVEQWNGANQFVETSSLNNGQWYHIGATFDTTNGLKLYVNSGTPTTATGTTIDGLSNTIFIGSTGTNTTYAFIGDLSNTQIWNTELSSSDVETLYNNGSPIETLANIPQNSNLQGWWKLDASATYDSSTNTWSIPDDSTNSNTGTSSGMTQANLVQSDLSFTSGYSPFALDFDAASSDYIDCGDSDDFSFNGTGDADNPFSISAWINMDDATKFRITNKYNGTSQNEYIFTTSGSDLLSLNLYDNSLGGYIGRKYNTALTSYQGQWIHVACTYDGTRTSSGIKLYLNGVKVDDTNNNSGNYTKMRNTSQPFIIAQQAGTYANGKISNCSIWNTDLTSSQVTEIYNEGVPSNLNNHSAYSNLVSWWQLGSNSSFNTNWTVLDEKGSNNGTSVNMTEDAIVDGVGSYANGLSSGMGGDEVIGDAPYSTANALSVNMDVEDRVTDTPS